MENSISTENSQYSSIEKLRAQRKHLINVPRINGEAFFKYITISYRLAAEENPSLTMGKILVMMFLSDFIVSDSL